MPNYNNNKNDQNKEEHDNIKNDNDKTEDDNNKNDLNKNEDDNNKNGPNKNEDKEKKEEIYLNLNIKESYSPNVKNFLNTKREQPETKTHISEKLNRKQKISENEMVDLENNSVDENSNLQDQMSFTQIKKEKEKLNNIIKQSQKRLNELEIIEKYKNELKEQINSRLFYEKENNNNNNTTNTVKQVISSYYKNNSKALEQFFKGLDQNGRNYVRKEINNLEKEYSLPFFKTDTINSQIIDLDENENENKNINPTSTKIKMLNNSQKLNDFNLHKSIKSSKYNSGTDLFNNKNNDIIKKSFKSQNNPNLYNNILKKSEMNEFNNYSYKCLTNNLNFVILKGTKEGMFSIELENNGSTPWLRNKTFLEFDDSKENINIQKMALEPLNPGCKTKVNIILNNMDIIKLGKYYICLIFKVNGIEYGDTLLVNIEVVDNTNKYKHKTVIKALTKEYDFSNTMFSNTMIGNALEEFKTFEGAVDKMLKEKN